MKNRLVQAMIAYAVLCVAAWFLLSGTPRVVILILFGYFALRTVIAHFRPEE